MKPVLIKVSKIGDPKARFSITITPWCRGERYSGFFHFPLDTYLTMLYIKQGCPRGEIVKAMDCAIVVSEFVLQLRYYVHVRAKVWNHFSSQLWAK